jgi:hypothetical protein
LNTLPPFEVNTDITFLDPDWGAFEERHDRYYGLAIDYLKQQVTGRSYANQAMELVVGEAGFYVQSKGLPAAFYGDMGRAQLRLVSRDEAQAIAWEATALYRAGEAQSLTCVYSAATPPEVFFGYRLEVAERYELGFLQGRLPIHLRVMVDASQAVEVLGHSNGVLLYQRLPDGSHVVLRAPGRRQPFPLLEGFDA